MSSALHHKSQAIHRTLSSTIPKSGSSLTDELDESGVGGGVMSLIPNVMNKQAIIPVWNKLLKWRLSFQYQRTKTEQNVTCEMLSKKNHHCTGGADEHFLSEKWTEQNTLWPGWGGRDAKRRCRLAWNSPAEESQSYRFRGAVVHKNCMYFSRFVYFCSTVFFLCV